TLDSIAQRTRWLSASLGPHDLPEHRMVGVSATVVSHGRADILGHLVEVPQKLLNRLAGQAPLAFECLVEVVHVCLVMAIVMDLHRKGIDRGLESVIGIRQSWQSVGHGVPPDANRACN